MYFHKKVLLVTVSSYFCSCQHLILLKNSILGKNSTFTQSNGIKAALEILYFRFPFLEDKKLLLMMVTINRLWDCSQLALKCKTDNDVKIW